MSLDDLERVLPIDSLQRDLTEKWIDPVLPDLEAEFLAIREVIDAELIRLYENSESSPGRTDESKKYPEGYCLQITNHALAEFDRHAAASPSPASIAVDSFRQAGGHFHRVWGILRGVYFQNALQIGSYYFDVANDTVNPAKPKVEYMPMAESGFRNVESFEEYAAIVESYCGGIVYPNTYFPMLAPLMPILWYSEKGILKVRSSIHFMLRMNVESQFRAAEHFLTESPWAGRPLPPEVTEALRRFKEAKLPADSRSSSTGASPEILMAQCEDYRGNRIRSSRAFLNKMVRWSSGIVIHVGQCPNERDRPPAADSPAIRDRSPRHSNTNPSGEPPITPARHPIPERPGLP